MDKPKTYQALVTENSQLKAQLELDKIFLSALRRQAAVDTLKESNAAYERGFAAGRNDQTELWNKAYDAGKTAGVNEIIRFVGENYEPLSWEIWDIESIIGFIRGMVSGWKDTMDPEKIPTEGLKKLGLWLGECLNRAEFPDKAMARFFQAETFMDFSVVYEYRDAIVKHVSEGDKNASELRKLVKEKGNSANLIDSIRNIARNNRFRDTETINTANAVRALVEAGTGVNKAIRQVASEENRDPGNVRVNYYRVYRSSQVVTLNKCE